jgi:EIN3-binding F-box protein
MTFLGQLMEISLQFCLGITDDGVIALSQLCRQLQDIDLKSCRITDQSVRAIASNCQQLRRLDLSWCTGVSDRAFVGLAGGAPRSLESIQLVWCAQLTDATLRALRGVPSLLRIDASGCTGMTHGGVIDLRQPLP